MNSKLLKIDHQLIFSLIPFLGLLIYCYRFVGSSFEVTDTGFNLANQMFLMKGWEEYSFGALWLADVIGMGWLYLTQPYGLVGASLGWCLLVALLGLMTFHFLSHFLPNIYASLLALTIGIIMIPGRLEILYYSNLGGALLMSSAFLFFIAMKDENHRKNSFVLLYGLSMASAIMVRFPSFLAALVFPLIFPFVQLTIAKRNVKTVIKQSFRLLTSSLVFTILFLLFIVLWGQWDEYLQNFKILLGVQEEIPIQAEHGLSNLLGIYWKQLTWRFAKGATLAGLFIFAVIVAPKAVRLNRSWSFPVFLFVMASIQSLLLFNWVSSDENNLRVIVATATLLLSLILLFGAALKKSAGTESKTQILQWTLLFLATALITFAGSNVGLLNMSKGLWLHFSFTLVFVGSLFIKDRRHVGLVMLALLLPLALKTYFVRLNSPYRDFPLKEARTQSIDHPKLKGVWTTPARAQNFGDFLKQATMLVKPDDYLLAYNSIPIMHFLLEAKPYLRYPWPGIQGKKAVEWLLKNPNSSQPPRIVLRALTNTQSVDWGNGRFVPPHNPVHYEGVQTIDRWIKEKGYQIYWKNRDFMILILEK